MGITNDSTFGTTKGNTDNSTLPCHPHGQRAYLIKRDLGAKTDTTFRRPAIDVVLHPVACEHLDITVIHAHREVDDKFAFGLA